MKTRWRWIVLGLVLAGVAITAAATHTRWSAWFARTPAAIDDEAERSSPVAQAQVLELGPEARRNLGLVVKPLKLQSYWRTIHVPGVIVDRPGRSDRGVTSPAVSVVAGIFVYPGDTVRPGDKLFSLRVFSEYLQSTQTELFKATRETQLVTERLKVLKKASESGAVPESRMIELDNQLRRQNAIIQACRQDLLTRGFSPSQIESVAEGNFVSTIDVIAPPPAAIAPSGDAAALPLIDQEHSSLAYEVQELNVDLGQQVQAGQLLCYLSNHHSLYIEGHAFKQEAPLLERAAQQGWPIRVEFAEDDSSGWPALEQTFAIRHLANTVDRTTRTLDFYIPLINQSRAYEKDGRTFVVWRFRPGQRVRLHVPVEEFQNVFVFPAAGIVREGPEAFVFRQNGDLFNRKSVHVLHEDRLDVVIANDGQIATGLHYAQNAAASLNRVLKAQAASGVPAGLHVHADGTVHEAH